MAIVLDGRWYDNGRIYCLGHLGIRDISRVYKHEEGSRQNPQ